MFCVRFSNFLTKALGVSFDQQKFEDYKEEKLSENVFDGLVEKVFNDCVAAVALKFEEKTQKAKQKKGKSWISSYLEEYNEELFRIFSRYVVENDMIEGKSTKPILLSILNLLRVPVEEKDMFLFDRMIENRFKNVLKGNQIKYLKLTYSQLISLLEE